MAERVGSGTLTALQSRIAALKRADGLLVFGALAGETGLLFALAAGLFSVVIDERFAQAAVDRFCDSLKLFKIGYSWGGPISLVMPYELPEMRQRATAHIKPGIVVRFAIGLEDVRDLKADLAQALTAAFA